MLSMLSRPARLIGAATLLCSAITAVQAQEYPTKPITIIIPSAAGGPSFESLRLITSKMTDIKQPFVLESKPGGAEIVAAVAAKAAAPDGYTLYQTTMGSMAINPALYKTLPYDPNKDFKPITNVFSFPSILTIPGDSPVKNLNDLVALSKSKQGGASYGSPSGGPYDDLIAHMLKSSAGLLTTVIAYKGAAPTVPDVISGRLDLAMLPLIVIAQHLDSGRLRAIGVAASKRLEGRPDLPTFAELGHPGVLAEFWFGLSAPAGSPDNAARLIQGSLLKATNDPAVKTFMAQRGLSLIPSASPEDYGRFIASEQARLEKAAREIGSYKTLTN